MESSQQKVTRPLLSRAQAVRKTDRPDRRTETGKESRFSFLFGGCGVEEASSVTGLMLEREREREILNLERNSGEQIREREWGERGGERVLNSERNSGEEEIRDHR